MKNIFLLAAFSIMLFCSGCISYSYDGRSESVFTSADKVKYYTPENLPQQKYTVLGTASVSANYQDVSREKMIEKLKSEAASNGADAILITEQKVSPQHAASTPLFQTQFDYDDTSSSWRQINRDVDLNYGSAFGRTRQTTTGISTYRRVIKAEFLRFAR